MAGGQARGPEADRLLTLAHTGSGTPALARDDAVEVVPCRPCPVLELPPAWPMGCGADNMPAFCLVCFHREEEEEPLEEVPLRRSVPGGQWVGEDPALRPGAVGPGGAACGRHPPLTCTFLLRPLPLT